MSKYIESFQKNRRLWWYSIMALILFITNLIIFFKGFSIYWCTDIKNCELYLFTKPIIIIVSIVLIFISISKIFKWNWLRKLFYFFRPFYKNSNTSWGKNFRVILILIIIPGLIFAFFYYYQLIGESSAFSGYNFFDQLSYILAYIGILLTVRVYFEVKEGHTESLEDFIKILTEILSLSDDDDEIVIYSPTLFLNEAHILQGKTDYRNTAYRNKLPKFMNLKLFILECSSIVDTIKHRLFVDLLNKKEESFNNGLKEYNLTDFEKIYEKIKIFTDKTFSDTIATSKFEDFKKSILDITEENKKAAAATKLDELISKFLIELKTQKLDSRLIKNADYNEFLCSLQTDNSLLNKFHQFSLAIEVPDNCGDKTNRYYRDFACFLYSLKDKIESKNYSFNGNGVNGDEYHGTFAISNFNKGIYYLGSFDVYSNGESFFRGTYFHNKYLDKDKLKSLIKEITE